MGRKICAKGYINMEYKIKDINSTSPKPKCRA